MPTAQVNLGEGLNGSDRVQNINAQGKALANIINWNPNNTLNFPSAATVDISKSILNSDNRFGDYTSISENLSLSNNFFIDYNIDMYKKYKYSSRFNETDSNGDPSIIEKIIFIDSFSEQVSNCKAEYNYSTNSININWEHIKSKTNNTILSNSTLTYNIWVCFKSNNNNLIRFDTSSSDTKSFTITHNVTNGINESGTSTQFTIQKGLYFIYVTPKFVTTVSEDPSSPYTKTVDLDYFKNNGVVTRPPSSRILIDPKAPKNFKITSSYDGKISFSWDKILPDGNIYPTQLRLTVINTSVTPNITTNFTINQNFNTYTLDNTDLSKANSLRPGNYNVYLCAIYYYLESDSTSTLNFTIPITQIDFSQKLVDLYGNVTKKIKNGVSGIIFNWKPLSYATYYKIVISQYNENNVQQQSQIYHVQHPTTNLSLKWNFPNRKSQFKTIISYTTDTSFTPDENTNALGLPYLAEEGQTYTKTFTPL